MNRIDRQDVPPSANCLAGRLIVATVLTAIVLANLQQSARAEITAEQVNQAIERGVAYLKRQQSARGNWADLPGFSGGVTCLCTLALLNSGVGTDDPAIRNALELIRDIDLDGQSKTYVVALKCMVLAGAEPEKDLPKIRECVKWLEQTQVREGSRDGSWAYPSRYGDNSNTQFAVLALHEAERVGVEANPATWRRSYKYWKESQLPSGAWTYVRGGAGMPGNEATGSMTSAGIASLVITSGKVSAGDAKLAGDQVQCCGQHTLDDTQERIERGLDWLGRPGHFSVEHNPGASHSPRRWKFYYLYALERVGRMTNRRFIGRFDWYRQGVEHLLEQQDTLSGFWKGEETVEGRTHISTALALLFLSKGRRPVVIAKLRYGQQDDWNQHRRDIAWLTRYTEDKWRRDLTWQVVDFERAKVEDLLQAPVLFLCGKGGLGFTEEQTLLLRDYIDRGGFIFADACCRGEGFDRSFRALMGSMFPEPEYKLQRLPPDHPVWRAEEPVKIGDYSPDLWGIDYGCRTCVVYCAPDTTSLSLSCLWELAGSGRDRRFPDAVQTDVDAANAVGVNVLAYATNREPKFKNPEIRVEVDDGFDQQDQRGVTYVAKLKHPGGCDAAPAALFNLLRTAEQQLGLRVSTNNQLLPITDASLFRYHLVFTHGRHRFRFTSRERQQLATFLDRGGTIMVDSICASREFTASFRDEVEQIVKLMENVEPGARLERIGADDPIFTEAYGGYDIRTVQRREPQRAGRDGPLKANVNRVTPDLEALTVGERYGIVFSPYDISCALEKHESLQCHGYVREDAAKIGLNVILYSLHR